LTHTFPTQTKLLSFSRVFLTISLHHNLYFSAVSLVTWHQLVHHSPHFSTVQSTTYLFGYAFSFYVFLLFYFILLFKKIFSSCPSLQHHSGPHSIITSRVVLPSNFQPSVHCHFSRLPFFYAFLGTIQLITHLSAALKHVIIRIVESHVLL